MSSHVKKKTAFADPLFKLLALSSAGIIMALVLAFFVQLFVESYPAFREYGISFIYRFNWEPRIFEFGAGGAILGTISTTLIAILIAVPVAFYVAFLLVEVMPPWIAKPIGAGIDLLAAVPSIIYGMWGFCVLLPLMQTVVQPMLQKEIPIYLGTKPAIVQHADSKRVISFKGDNGWIVCDHNDYLSLKDEFMILGKIKIEKSKNQTLISKGDSSYVVTLSDKNQIMFNGVYSDENVLKNNQTHLFSIGEKDGSVQCFIDGKKVKLHGEYQPVANNEHDLLIGNGFLGEIEYIQLFTQYQERLSIRHPVYLTQESVDHAIDEIGLTALFDASGDQERITDRASGLDGYFKAKKIDLNFLNKTLFSSESAPMGSGPLTAGVILALMILPYICAVMRDVLEMTPGVLKESAYGLGSTSWETTFKVTLRYGMQGFLGAIFLGLGRALGETMAVLFVIGNVVSGNFSLIAPSSTIASTLANSFPEASGLFRNVLFALGFVLLVLTFGIQVIAQWWLNKVRKTQGTGL